MYDQFLTCAAPNAVVISMRAQDLRVAGVDDVVEVGVRLVVEAELAGVLLVREAATFTGWPGTGLPAIVGNVVGSFGSLYFQSVAVKYEPESLYPHLLSPNTPAWRNEPCSIALPPPSTEIVVPFDWNGDFVMMCSTPFAEFGP